MSSDLISREFLQTAIHNFFNGLKHTPTEEDIQRYIEVAPPIKVEERPKGEWIIHEEEFSTLGFVARGGVKCSICGYKTHNNLHMRLGGCPFKFCPDCGADMRKERKLGFPVIKTDTLF